LKVGEDCRFVAAGHVLIMPDVHSDPRFSARLDEMTGCRPVVICVPLRSKQLGVLGVTQAGHASVA